MSRMGSITYDKERDSFNIARLKKGGDIFEIIVDPDLAISFKEGKEVSIKEILHGEKIMSDAQRALHASSTRLNELFGTEDPLVIARKILEEGEIQLTQEHRTRVREEKRKRLINLIARNAIDPKTKLPHPPQRIENAMAEVKVKIAEFRTVEDQLDDVVKQLMPVLPIRFEQKKLSVRIPAQYAPKVYGALVKFGKPLSESWADDGSWLGELELPAGLVNDFLDKMNGMTQGSIEVKIIGE